MPSSKTLSTSLNFQEDYPCPVCRVGRISPMPLMEAMSCNFCQEIFTVNLEIQQIKMPSRQPPLVWHWNGFKWTEAQLEGVELGWGYVLAAMAFVILPTTLIGLAAYYFPPNPDVPLSWLPYIWTLLTFLLHLSIIVWIFIEVYQIPIGAYFRAINRLRNSATR
ncbi:hypothetical protein H6G54_26395 [Anabaena cylindrica FACHB-243]|nr:MULTISPECIES: hypothetical protein [Anabaena]MBD2421155.1 hypothetical protein [Anabaena cylindrica FACHB-243]MBY5281138.1 hypothetical protein [Anabaena sp. CCAP 1446/1C]MBY5308548.1 hypothetical protein [Anabaena sp. CCAP 1446/1C]MCM2405910.1 CorA family divalent cation transporter [Anabaena sp. CCAP 1446/1C]